MSGRKKIQYSHVPLLATVFGTLIFLTILTVAASKINFGFELLNILIALSIASLKSWVVVHYFMHLKWENKLTKVFSMISLPFLFLILFVLIADLAARILEGQFL